MQGPLQGKETREGEKKKKKKKEALAGFEPAISCLLDRRFNQLSHRAKLSGRAIIWLFDPLTIADHRDLCHRVSVSMNCSSTS